MNVIVHPQLLVPSAQTHNIITHIEQLLQNASYTENKHPIIIAIDGMSGSGKTTLGEFLHEHFSDSNLFHMDHYFLQPHQRTEDRLSEIGGNVDFERFKSEILDHLTEQAGLTYRIYNCQSQNLGPKIFIPWKPLVIIEGAYSHHPYFGDPYSLRVFCNINIEQQIERIKKRNGTVMLERFLNEWIPKENLYFQTFHIKEKADLLL